LKAAFANINSSKASFAALASVFLYVVYVFILPVAFRYFGPPPLQVDDSYFFLISYSWLNGLGFNNFWVNPIETTIFNWHGFLQPMLVGQLSPCNSLRCVNAGLIALGVVYLAIWYVVVNSITSDRFLRWTLYVIAVSLVLEYSARPELLASLELIFIVLLFYFFPANRQFVVRAVGSGIAVGLAFLTAPHAGLSAGLGVAAATAYLRRNDRSPVNFILEGLLALICALCTLAIILIFIYPHPWKDWIDGIITMAIRDTHRTDGSGFFRFYFLRRTLPLLGITLFTLAAIAGRAFKEMWQTRSPFFLTVFLLVCATFLCLLYFSAIRIPLTYYNFTVLIPSIILVAVIYRNKIGTTEQYARLTFTSPLVVFAAACIFSQIIWTARWLNERPDHRRLFEGIASSVDQYLAENRRIAMDAPLIGAVDDIEKLKKIEVLTFGTKHKLGYNPPDVDVLFRDQNEFGIGVLGENIPEFKLVADHFDHSPLAQRLTPNELYYAIYERVPH
jgi:hypothetical protein